MDLEWIDFSKCDLAFKISGSLDQFFKGYQLVLFSKLGLSAGLGMDLEWIDFSKCDLAFKISGSLDQFFKGYQRISGSLYQFFKGFQLILFSKLEKDLGTWNGLGMDQFFKMRFGL